MARRLGVARSDVIDAALRVSDRRGLADLTVAAVAAEVGCRPPSVYHHVDGLDGLVREVTLVAARDLADAVTDAVEGVEGDGVAQLRTIVAAAHGWGVANPARFDAVRRPVDADADPELAAARAAVVLPVQDALVALDVHPERRPALVAALVAAVRGCIAADLDADAPDAPASASARAEGRELLVDLLLDHIDADRHVAAP